MPFDVEAIIAKARSGPWSIHPQTHLLLRTRLHVVCPDGTGVWRASLVFLTNMSSPRAIAAARAALQQNLPMPARPPYNVMEDSYLLFYLADAELPRQMAVEIIDPYEPFDSDAVLDVMPLPNPYTFCSHELTQAL